jgi:hypothetical protein
MEGWCGMDSFGSGEGLAACSYENGNKPLSSINARNFMMSSSTINISKRTLLHGVR